VSGRHRRETGKARQIAPDSLAHQLLSLARDALQAGARSGGRMFSNRLLGLIVVGGSSLAIACSSSRDVEVSGSVASAASVQSEILLQFFDLTGKPEQLERSEVHSATLAAPGAFKETISVEGDSIAVRAIADANGDGACSAGEAWAEVEAPISGADRVEDLALSLAFAPCPDD
jgi:hypothetical protein